MKDELENIKIERQRILVDLVKWFVGGIVVVIGFLLIRPHEQERLDEALQLEVFKAYLAATNTENIYLWQRKLNLIKATYDENNKKVQIFIEAEQKRLDHIISEDEKFRKAILHKAKLQNSLTENKKKFEELKKEYDNLEEASAKEKMKLENEKRELEIRIAELESDLHNATKQENESANNLKKFGLSMQYLRHIFVSVKPGLKVKTEYVTAGPEG
jgi:chromosome segregation ATPase